MKNKHGLVNENKHGLVNGGSRDGEMFYSELDYAEFIKQPNYTRGVYSTEQYKKSFHFWVEDGVRTDWYEWDLLS